MESNNNYLNSNQFDLILKKWGKSPEILESDAENQKISMEGREWSVGPSSDKSVASFFKNFIEDHKQFLEKQHFKSLFKISLKIKSLNDSVLIKEKAMQILFSKKIEPEVKQEIEMIHVVSQYCNSILNCQSLPEDLLKGFKINKVQMLEFAQTLAVTNPAIFLLSIPWLKIPVEHKQTLADTLLLQNLKSSWEDLVIKLYNANCWGTQKVFDNQTYSWPKEDLIVNKLSNLKELYSKVELESFLSYFQTAHNRKQLISFFSKHLPQRIFDKKGEIPLHSEEERALCFKGMLKHQKDTLEKFEDFNIRDEKLIIDCMKAAFNRDPKSTLKMLKTMSISKEQFLTFQLSERVKMSSTDRLIILKQLILKNPWKGSPFNEKDFAIIGLNVQTLASDLLRDPALRTSENLILIASVINEPNAFLLEALRTFEKIPVDVIPNLQVFKLSDSELYAVARRVVKENPTLVLSNPQVFSSLGKRSDEIMVLALVNILNQLHTTTQMEHEINSQFFKNLIDILKKNSLKGLNPENQLTDIIEKILMPSFKDEKLSKNELHEQLFQNTLRFLKEAQLHIPDAEYVRGNYEEAGSKLTFLGWMLYTAMASKCFSIPKESSKSFNLGLPALDLIRVAPLRYELTENLMVCLSPLFQTQETIQEVSLQLMQIFSDQKNESEMWLVLMQSLCKTLKMRLKFNKDQTKKLSNQHISQFLSLHKLSDFTTQTAKIKQLQVQIDTFETVLHKASQEQDVKVKLKSETVTETVPKIEEEDPSLSPKVAPAPTSNAKGQIKKLKKQIEEIQNEKDRLTQELEFQKKNLGDLAKSSDSLETNIDKVLVWLEHQLLEEAFESVKKRETLSNFKFQNILLQIFTATQSSEQMHDRDKLHLTFLTLCALKEGDSVKRKNYLTCLLFMIKFDTDLLKPENSTTLEAAFLQMNRLLEKRLHILGIEDVDLAQKFAKTFAMSREPYAIFNYLKSLEDKNKMNLSVQKDLKIFVEHYLNGSTFKDYRYNSSHSAHLKKCYEASPLLQNKWCSVGTKLDLKDLKIKFSDIQENWTVSISDHQEDLFLFGTEVDNCLSVFNGKQNENLLGHMNGKNQLVCVKNEKGVIEGAAIIKLMLVQGKPVLLVEVMYTKETQKAKIKAMGVLVEAQCLERAKELGLPLYFERGFFKQAFGSEDPKDFPLKVRYSQNQVIFKAFEEIIPSEYVDSSSRTETGEYKISKATKYFFIDMSKESV